MKDTGPGESNLSLKPIDLISVFVGWDRRGVGRPLLVENILPLTFLNKV